MQKLQPIELDSDPINQTLVDQAYEKTKDHFGKWHLLEFKRTGQTNQLRFLVHPNGHAEAVITRQPDDTVSFTVQDEPKSSFNLHYVKDLCNSLLNQIGEHFTNEILQNDTTRKQLFKQLINDLPFKTNITIPYQMLIDSIIGSAVTPAGPTKIHYDDLSKIATRLIATQITKPKYIQLTKDIFDQSKISYYNFTVVNEQLTTKLVKDIPAVLNHFALHQATLGNLPGQAVFLPGNHISSLAAI